MPTFQASGRSGICTKFVAVAGGTAVTFPVPVKSFIICPVGGDITFKFSSTDDGFPISDGQSLQFDLSLAYPIASNVCTVGTVFGSDVDTYVLAAY